MSNPFKKQKLSSCPRDQGLEACHPQYSSQKKRSRPGHTPYPQSSHHIQQTRSEGPLGQQSQQLMQQVRRSSLAFYQTMQHSQGGHPMQRGNGDNTSGSFGTSNNSSFSSINLCSQHLATQPPSQGGHLMQRGNGNNTSGLFGATNNSHSQISSGTSRGYGHGGNSISNTAWWNSATPTNNRQNSMSNGASSNSTHGNNYGQQQHAAQSMGQCLVSNNSLDDPSSTQKYQYESQTELYSIDDHISSIASENYKYRQRGFPSDEAHRLYDATCHAWNSQSDDEDMELRAERRQAHLETLKRNPMSFEFLNRPQYQNLCQRHAHLAPSGSEGYHPSIQQSTSQPSHQSHLVPQQIRNDPMSFATTGSRQAFLFPSTPALLLFPPVVISGHTRWQIQQSFPLLYRIESFKGLYVAQGKNPPMPPLQIPKPSYTERVWESKINVLDRKAELGVQEPPDCDACDEEIQDATRSEVAWHGWLARWPSIAPKDIFDHALQAAKEAEADAELARASAQHGVDGGNIASTGESLLSRVLRSISDVNTSEAATTLLDFAGQTNSHIHESPSKERQSTSPPPYSTTCTARKNTPYPLTIFAPRNRSA